MSRPLGEFSRQELEEFVDVVSDVVDNPSPNACAEASVEVIDILERERLLS